MQICKVTERIIKKNFITKHKLKFEKIVNEIFSILANEDIFNMDNHIKDTFYYLNNHYYILLKLICKYYINIRCFHAARNESSCAKVRQKLHKLIHLKNQWKIVHIITPYICMTRNFKINNFLVFYGVVSEKKKNIEKNR